MRCRENTSAIGWLWVLLILLVATHGSLFGQAPLGVNYQGVARNMDGTPKSDKAISIRVSIMDGGISGIVEYSEIHQVTTNQFGLFSLVIGQGEHAGSIQDVAWSSGNKWLQIEIDAEGGSSFEIIGAQQIFSVPYAMYATQAGTGVEAGAGIEVDDGVVTNIAPDQPVTLLGAGDVTVSGSYPDFIIEGTDNVNDADPDPINELILSVELNGTNLEITDRGGVFITDLSSVVNDNDADPANELQTLLQVGDDVTLSNGGGSISVADNDADPGNELQTLNQVGSSVTLSNSGGTISIDDTDPDPANELQTLLQVGNDVTLSNGGGTISVADNDADPGNELQTLNQVGSSVTLSNSGGTISIDDPDPDPANEIQDLVSVLGQGNSAGNNKISNVLDPTLAQDVTTKNYVDTRSVDDADSDPANEIQDLVSVLGQGNSAGNNKISNVLDPTLAQDAATKNYVDTRSVDDPDADPSNEIQDLVSVLGQGNSAGSNKISNVLDPTLPQDVTTKNYVDTRSVDDADADPANEIQDLVSVLGQGNSAGNNKISNVLDPSLPQDVATKNYVDTRNVDDADANPLNEIQDLSEVLVQSNDAGGVTITNLADPVLGSDAVTKDYLDLKDATDFAFKSLVAGTGSGSFLIFDLSTTDFDEGGLISVNQITISEAGIYMFNVKGNSSLNAPIVINVNGTTDYPVGLINIGKYSDTILLKLNPGDILQLKANSTTSGEVFSLEFFGFKI